MSPGARSVLALVLAPLAVLAVTAAGVTAAVVHPGPTGSGDEVTAVPRDVLVPAGRRLYADRGGRATALLPDSSAWRAQDEFVEIGFSSDGGEVSVRGPATYELGFCSRRPDVPRAFVGFDDAVDAADTTVAEAATSRLEEWVAAARVTDSGERLEVAGETDGELTLDDGVTAWSASAVVVDEDDGCSRGPVEVRVVSAVAGQDVVALVLVRDVSADGGDAEESLSAADAEEIAVSLDPR